MEIALWVIAQVLGMFQQPRERNDILVEGDDNSNIIVHFGDFWTFRMNDPSISFFFCSVFSIWVTLFLRLSLLLSLSSCLQGSFLISHHLASIRFGWSFLGKTLCTAPDLLVLDPCAISLIWNQLNCEIKRVFHVRLHFCIWRRVSER